MIIIVKQAYIDIKNKLFINNSYKEDFLASRYAIFKAIQKFYPKYYVNNLTELAINNYHNLQKFPNILVSVAHTKSTGVAFLSDDLVKGVGIDIELVARNLKKGIKKYYQNDLDDNLIDELYLWTAKEAAFKSISYDYKVLNKRNLFLTDIWIRNNEFGIKNDILGKITWEVKDKYLIACAIYL